MGYLDAVSASPSCVLLFSAAAYPCRQRQRPLRQHPPLRRPDFFILGTRKGGTTSLYTYLAQHPAVFRYKLDGGPSDGENPAPLLSPAYDEPYRHAAASQLVGDSRVSRLVDDANVLPRFYGRTEPRLIALLREPVARCHSQFQMRAHLGPGGLTRSSNISVSIGKDLQSFETLVASHPDLHLQPHPREPPHGMRSSENCLYEGAYVLHLRRLLAKMDASTVRVYWSESMLDPGSREPLVRDAFSFLGLAVDEVTDFKAVLSHTYNAAPETQVNNPNLVLATPLVQRMRLAMAPFNRELSTFLGAPLHPAWMYS
jgi:hypothetical protein